MTLLMNTAQILLDVTRALEEDLGSGDVSAELLPANLSGEAEILSREPMVVCGRPWVDEVFAAVNSTIKIEWFVKEGQWLAKPTTLCQVRGSLRSILTAERSALNFLQTLSATATQTHAFVQMLGDTSTRLLDTRKTLPGLRYAQKYAVRCGGGTNHRMGLYDAFLIKENHIRACGSLTTAIARARALYPELLLVVEVETLEELQEALCAKPDRILLDNFSQAMLKEAVVMKQGFSCKLEASGGIDKEDLKTVAAIGVDYISVGALTKSVRAIDLSLLVRTL